MKRLVLILISLAGTAQAQTEFQVGLYADEARTISCISGSAGDQFEHILWAYVPEDLALSYITIRFRFPDNLDFKARPVFHDQIGTVIYTNYILNSVEWNMVFTGCPTGWVKVFSQQGVFLDDQPSRIEILGTHSLTRDCTFFELHDILVLNELEVNDPECASVPTTGQRWGSLKALYR